LGGDGLVVGLTGATGHIGGRLLARLVGDPAVGSIRSVARRPLPPELRGPAVAHVEADVSSPAARAALRGVDVLYHLAAQVWAGRGAGAMDAMHRANVEGANNVLEAAPAAAVLASSVSVYGAWPANPLPMTEDHLPRPNPECAYAQHKWVAERMWAQGGGGWAVARLSAVLGPHADVRVARSVRGYRLAVPAVRGVAQAVQWLDEEDAVSGLLALGQALLAGQPGAAGRVFNLAPPDWLGAADVARVAGGRVVALPRARLLRLAEAARVSRATPFGADRAVLLSGPLAATPDRAAEVLGWRPQRSSAQVLGAALGRPWRAAPRNRAL
jgi:UDP-glucose 4-epimerase